VIERLSNSEFDARLKEPVMSVNAVPSKSPWMEPSSNADKEAARAGPAAHE
jgi:hypothetical protein